MTFDSAYWAELSREFEEALRRERVDFRARESLLFRRDDYKHRRALAHDLRNSEPFGRMFLEWKQEYRWAEDAWLLGRLTAREFHARVQEFDAAVQRASEWEDRTEDHNGIRTTAEAWTKWIRRRNRDGFVSHIGWHRRHEQLALAQERNERWLVERQQRRATAQQRMFLRQGHQTLSQLRRVLRGQEALPLPGSTPARSSQI